MKARFIVLSDEHGARNPRERRLGWGMQVACYLKGYLKQMQPN